MCGAIESSCLYCAIEMEMAQEETKEPEEETKEVQFQFKKKQSERAINAIQSSYAYKKQQMNAEHWVELQVNDKNVRANTGGYVPNAILTLILATERGGRLRVREPVQ